MTILAAAATITGVFLGFSGVPQAIKIFKRKSAKDVSLLSYLIVEFGSLVWILYGLEINSFPIVIPNFLGLVTTSVILVGCFMYGGKAK